MPLVAAARKIQRLLRRPTLTSDARRRQVQRRIALLAIVTSSSLALSSTLFWLFERGANEQIGSWFDAVWWWIVTSATVGYGDIVPITLGGRLVTIVAILTGFFVFTHLVAMIAESVHGFLERKDRGTAHVEAHDHVVICEYTAVADELIQNLPELPQLAGREVIVVSDLVSSNPLRNHHFVYGVPFSPEALAKASIEHARYVFVFANLRFADPDLKTLHIATRVMSRNPGATVFVELAKPQNPLLAHCPAGLRVLDSRTMLEHVLQHRPIDPFEIARPPKMLDAELSASAS